jgi:hypothetical protein
MTGSALVGLDSFSDLGECRQRAWPASSRDHGRTSSSPLGRGRTLNAVELVRGACCGRAWVGADRAHCCARRGFTGCGQVFDDANLFDAHRLDGRCANPHRLGLVQTKNGIWLRALDLVPAS